MRALIVDDSRVMRSVIRKVLAELPFDELYEAGHGGEALAQLAEHGRMDLVLIDWNMPEMNGYELIKALRNDPANESVRLMMVTSESETQRIMQALMAGADEYLMKPFTAEALIEKLHLIGLRLERTPS